MACHKGLNWFPFLRTSTRCGGARIYDVVGAMVGFT